MKDKLLTCNNIAEALRVSGWSHLELYNFLKSQGVKTEFPATWFDQLRELEKETKRNTNEPYEIPPIDPTIEYDLEKEFEAAERFRTRRRYVEYDSDTQR